MTTLSKTIESVTLVITANQNWYHYAECRAFIVMLNVFMLSVLGPIKMGKAAHFKMFQKVF
jgi:hypothetical protein